MFLVKCMNTSCDTIIRGLPYGTYDVNIASGNGLVPPRNKPISRVNFDPGSSRHAVSIDHNEVNKTPWTFDIGINANTYMNVSYVLLKSKDVNKMICIL